MTNKIYELKMDLKSKAKNIKKDRKEHKRLQREHSNNSMDWEVAKQSRDFRHYHIAYCELRGTHRGCIEKPRKGNEPNEKLIENIKEGYSEHKAICVST